MEGREQWRHILRYTLVGLALTLPFFAIGVVTLFHLDLEVVDLVFAYAVIANPYYPFQGIGWLLAGIQWPAYGFVAGVASAKRDPSMRGMTKLLLVLLLSSHRGSGCGLLSPCPPDVRWPQNGESATQQSLAADGAIACFFSNLIPFSLNADRAPQLKAGVRRSLF